MAQDFSPHGLAPVAVQALENAVTVVTSFAPECDYFDGHFPRFKLLPAVAQVDLVTLYAWHYLHIPRTIRQIKRFKFSEKIRPGATVAFTITFNKDTGAVSFKLTDAENGTAYSSGTYLAA